MPVYVIYAQDLLGVEYHDVITAQDESHALACLDAAYAPSEGTTKRGCLLLTNLDECLVDSKAWLETQLAEGNNRDD